MASIEIDLEGVVPEFEVRDGRRVIVLKSRTDEMVLVLPDRDPWAPAFRLTLALERITNEIREQVRSDVHRGPRPILVGPSEPPESLQHGHGPLTGPVMFFPGTGPA